MSEVLLTDLARVSVRPEYLKPEPLSFHRKRELRTQIIKDYILSKPYGTRIKMGDFQRILGMGTNANAHMFIEGLVKDGVITKEHLSPRRFFYTVPGALKVTKPAEKMVEPKEGPKLEPVVQTVVNKEVTDLESKAMTYLWYNPSGDVRDFVKWVQSQ